MITFLHTSRNTHPMRYYLGSPWGRAFFSRIAMTTYARLLARGRLPRGVSIFADLESVDLERYPALCALCDAADRDAGVRILNDPRRALRRYDLLKAMHDQGINDFRAYRAGEDLSGVRFPVFVRNEWDHAGAHSPLIEDHDELERAVARLRREHGRYFRPLICEFRDTRDDDGLYRKYAAFVLGNTVIPRHVFFGKNWLLKQEGLCDPDKLAEEKRYVTTNPDEQPLRDIFRRAGIEYGRIDYAKHGGRIMVWEINTNPVILTQAYPPDSPRFVIHKHFAHALAGALEALCESSPASAPRRLTTSLNNRLVCSGLPAQWARLQRFARHVGRRIKRGERV